MGQDGDTVHQKLKLCGQDSDSKTKSCDGNCIPKKRKRKRNLVNIFFEYDSASFLRAIYSPLKEVDNVTYNLPLSLNTQDEPQITLAFDQCVKRFEPFNSKMVYMLGKSKSNMQRNNSSFICHRRRSVSVFEKKRRYL